MKTWQDVFTLREVNQYEYGGFSRIGGDPESHHNPKVYLIIDKVTGDLESGPHTIYTAEYYAKKRFLKILNNIDNILVGETNG